MGSLIDELIAEYNLLKSLPSRPAKKLKTLKKRTPRLVKPHRRSSPNCKHCGRIHTLSQHWSHAQGEEACSYHRKCGEHGPVAPRRKKSKKRTAPKKRATKKRSTKRAAPKKRATKKRSTKRAAPKKRATKKRSTKRAAPKKRATPKRSARKQTTKRTKKRSTKRRATKR